MTPTETTEARSPIFILGMLQRTGTNHLWDLCSLHPDVVPLEPVFEDHLVRWSPHLLAYTEDVTRCWSPEWEVPASEGDALLRSIGDGIVAWVASHAEERIVTKMPSVEQAENFAALFPACPLIVLTRDGRAVSESGVKSFGWSYERAFRRWSKAADVVVELIEQHRDNPRFKVVRYEDLVESPAEVMAELCAVAGLDAEHYPFDKVGGAPVIGSSTLRTEQGSEIHWDPQERTDDFDPRLRWQSWSDHTHRRFAEVAGSQQMKLGYDLEAVDGDSSVADRARDLRAYTDVRVREARVLAGRARRNLKRVHGRV